MTLRTQITIFLLAVSLAISAQTAGKTFNKSFNVENRSTILLDLPGVIDIIVWDNPHLKFEIGVTLSAGNNSLLNELANMGRYDLVSKAEGDVLTITAPNLLKQLKLKGEVLKETLTYQVFVPKDLKIELPNATAAADLKK